jgi:hypothetical protein
MKLLVSIVVTSQTTPSLNGIAGMGRRVKRV